jgi:hypothetical protein
MLRKLVWVALAALAVYVPARAEAVIESPHILNGVVYCDSNGDGLLTAGEQGIAGVEIKIESFWFDGGFTTVTTDANGAWTIDTRNGGDFSISIPEGQGPRRWLCSFSRSARKRARPTASTSASRASARSRVASPRTRRAAGAPSRPGTTRACSCP